ncbi:hypothetical protein [Microlunatus speluncae]|uniref:hypothetical protein n=1 Tax=Microlunatus speluncae TaxID=2594267 RepID=UPI00126652DF|nr:hypothetical protein [Microlunatus speluncae]
MRKVEQKRLDLYIRAIGQLDAERKAGEIDQVRWEVLRAKLLSEAIAPKRPADLNLLILLGCMWGLVAIGYVIIQLLLAIS